MPQRLSFYPHPLALVRAHCLECFYVLRNVYQTDKKQPILHLHPLKDPEYDPPHLQIVIHPRHGPMCV